MARVCEEINILEVHRLMMVTSSISNVNYQGLGAASSCRLLAVRYACSLQAHEYYDTGRVVPMLLRTSVLAE